MRKLYTLTVLALVCAAAVVLNAACKAGDQAGADRAASTSPTTTSTTTNAATPHPTSTPGDNVRRISVADAQKAVARNEAVIVDVRAKSQYDQSHIKGSLSIPKNELPTRLSELPKDKLIIFYCA
jgi:rhodanese-related sulfurtransferase